MKKREMFAPFLMLLAGAVTAIVMFMSDYSTTQLLVTLLLVLIFFYIIGVVIQKKVWGYIDQIEEEERLRAENEGEVIEKEVVANDENEAGT